MKIGRWARVLLAGMPLLAGCKDFWQAPTSTTTTPTTTASSGVFYVLNQGTKQIAAYSIVSGTLTAVTGSPYTFTAAPYSIAIAPNGGFLYVGTAVGVYVYTIGSGGALTVGNNGSVISTDQAYTMHVDATSSWLVEAVSGVAQLNAIPISSTTGLFNSSSSEKVVTLPAATVQQLAMSPADSSTCTDCYVFVALGSGGTAVVPFNPTNTDPFGTATTIALKNPAGGADTVAVDPSNRLLYVGESAATSGTQSGGLRAFTIGATITEVTGSPYGSGGTGPSAILPTASGDYVYVANKAVSGSSTGNITGFSFTSTGTVYSLTALSSTASAGTSPIGLAEDSQGTFVLVVDSGGSPDLEAYTFDSTTAGKLDSALTSSTGTDPVQASAIAALP